MRLTHSFIPSLLLLAAGAAQAASSWGFDDGSVAVTSKKAEGVRFKEKYAASTFPSALLLSSECNSFVFL